MEIDVMPMDRLAKIYRKMRSAIEVLTKEYDTQVEAIKEQQEGVKNAMKEQMKALGVSSVKSPFGTVSMRQSTRYNTNDWGSFKEFILEHGAIELLEKRIAQTNMAQFLEENPGVLPPGLNSHSEFNIVITKPTK